MSTVTTRASAASVRTGADPAAPNPDGPPGGPPGGPPPDGPGGNQGPAGGNLPIQGAPVPFALVPAQASQGVLDYSRAEGVKTFQSATRSLYSDSSELFNCDIDGLWDFLQLVEQRSSMMGFQSIYEIPHRETPTSTPVALSFLSNYGVLSTQEVQTHATSYIGTQTRAAQDSIMLYHMLWNSLSATGRAKVGVQSEHFVINGITAGVAFLKVIIDDSGVETHATVSNIRTQLSNLDEYMVSIDSDIKKFNIHVKKLIISLYRHREKSTDLLTHLFKGYKAVSDIEFVQFIKRKEESYEEGNPMSAEDLMKVAEGKYKIRFNRGEWKAAPEADKRILALEAKINGLEKKGSSTKKEKHNGNKGKAPGKVTSLSKKPKKGEIPEWMTSAPKQGDERKPKTIDGKEYWWCIALKRWCVHKPVDCRALKGKDKKYPARNNEYKKKLKFAQALEAIDSHEEEDSE